VNVVVDVALIEVIVPYTASATPYRSDIGRQAQLDDGEDETGADEAIEGNMECQHGCRQSSKPRKRKGDIKLSRIHSQGAALAAVYYIDISYV
jgi:hypothetical protein